MWEVGGMRQGKREETLGNMTGIQNEAEIAAIHDPKLAW